MSIFYINDASGQWQVSGTDFTFRYVAAVGFTSASNGDVVIPYPGISTATHFAITADARSGFPLVEQDQIRIKQSVFGGGGVNLTVYLFRI